MTQLTRDTPKAVLPPTEVVTECTKLATAHFVNAAAFDGVNQSVSVPRNADSIVPARLEPDGTAVAISSGQRADGIVIRRKVTVRSNNTKLVVQSFVPWANISSLQYEAP